ncbi:MAG: hypothetical protein A3H71_01530 [Candidatus Sungbacteria bacterium RIFCSPLOWO2_02_FULL_48_13b]|uniref:Cell division protein FtsX n=2 Tax=Candidatus Sungiibacteriota TaxID=1817917 RepID=A0A1G2LEQ4_9BACT|nr:MAG: hypothetical protein A3C12_02570 [Candidatus Sungbacteria bacterium RIFCSPHIGHO2_02_FULL_49_20]OHA10080.1 MAG: hypothetical protein A3H71_01530 [Candidatus Sungbacteria bacterium RIFCSPLOWO2_02_FULL_48_13b]
MFVKLKRVIKAAMASFWRNGWLSTATILVMASTLFVIGGLLLSSYLLNSTLASFQQKIDISVYFPPDTPEDAVLDFKSKFETIPNVSAVTYVSQAEALERFKQDYKTNQIIVDSLNEVDGNPLQASLNIRAADTSRFSEIVTALEKLKDAAAPKIDFTIDYRERVKAIDKLTKIIAVARLSGAGLSLALAFMAVLVTLNAVRMAIYTARDEINVMRLVGATAWFIRGPFLMEGIIDGIIAAVGATLLYFPIVWWLSPKVLIYVDSGIDLRSYFVSHLFSFFAILLIIGVVLGALSSFLAVRRYLKV